MINELIFIAQVTIIMLSIVLMLRWEQTGLTALAALFAVMANLMVSKQITIFGLSATASDTFIIGASLSLNVLQEFYGRQAARYAVWISFATLFFFTIMSVLHLNLIPSVYDHSHAHYQAILGFMPRLAAASLTAYFTSEWFNYFLFKRLKAHSDNYFTLRSFTSTALAQLVDTLIFSFLGLYGIIENITSIIFVSFTIKIVALLMALPFLSLVKKLHATQER